MALNSIKSVEKFVSKNNVIVFYTPPRSIENYRTLSNVANVIEVENITKPFSTQVYSKKGLAGEAHRYGEKVHLCEVDFPNVVF
jgi:hypothetical protein